MKFEISSRFEIKEGCERYILWYFGFGPFLGFLCLMHYEVLALLKPVNFSLLNLLKNFGCISDEICDFEQI